MVEFGMCQITEMETRISILQIIKISVKEHMIYQ